MLFRSVLWDQNGASYIQLQAYTCLQLVIAYVRASASIKHALLVTQTVGLAASHEMLQTFSAYSGRLSSHSTMEASMFTSMVRKLAGFPSLLGVYTRWWCSPPNHFAPNQFLTSWLFKWGKTGVQIRSQCPEWCSGWGDTGVDCFGLN